MQLKITYYDACLVAPLPHDKATNTEKKEREKKKDDNNLDMFALNLLLFQFTPLSSWTPVDHMVADLMEQ